MSLWSPAKRIIILVDAVINLALGALLLAFPFGVAELLGVPSAESSFYPMILGGVLFGIGVALLIECSTGRLGGTGLGVEGAIAINICGALALAGWLLFGGLELPLRGQVALWIICALVLATACVEIVVRLNKT